MRSFLSVLKKIILWSYQRGSWQYDVLCILILAFIFFTPSSCFNPEPENPQQKVEQPEPPAVSPLRQPEPVSQDEKKQPTESPKQSVAP